MITLYNADFEEIWHHSEGPDSPQDYDRAQDTIKEIWKSQGNKYVYWDPSKEFDLHDGVGHFNDRESYETGSSKQKEEYEHLMHVQNQKCPIEGIETHPLYDDTYLMYVIVGQSAALRFVMSEELHEEIARGLWWFMLSLLGGNAICFVIMSSIFERKLQQRIAKPISELAKQIKNPNTFMAGRNKSVDMYSRKLTSTSRGRG